MGSCLLIRGSLKCPPAPTPALCFFSASSGALRYFSQYQLVRFPGIVCSLAQGSWAPPPHARCAGCEGGAEARDRFLCCALALHCSRRCMCLCRAGGYRGGRTMKQVMSECLYCTPGTAPDFPCTVSPAGDVAISHLTDEVLQVCASCPPSHSLEGRLLGLEPWSTRL